MRGPGEKVRRRGDQICLDWVTEMIRRKGEIIRRKCEKEG